MKPDNSTNFSESWLDKLQPGDYIITPGGRQRKIEQTGYSGACLLFVYVKPILPSRRALIMLTRSDLKTLRYRKAEQEKKENYGRVF